MLVSKWSLGGPSSILRIFSNFRPISSQEKRTGREDWKFPCNGGAVKKILVVEDDESQRILYHDEFVEAGYEVILAANGKEALKRLDKSKPDLIILDIVMPVMDGMEALARIIRKYRDVPIILNTAYSTYRDDFMSWGADAYIVKSSDLGELKARVKEFLAESRSFP